ncbi:MAG: TetR/AcrR family transcriptional regulator [Actinomycetota bacterium]|nr:TetR/AcrR family transcriptional regulator [Actinomycetota bacterium]
MLKADAQTGQDTRTRIVEAALETLKREGFSGTSARAIAATGGFNQALIFYHFGSVKDLLLAALDATSARRLEAYEAAVAEAETLENLVQVAARIYQEDLASGHVTVLSEMIAGSLAHPDLGPEIAARIEPWVDFADGVVARVLRDSPFATFLPARDIAYAIVAFYLGLEQLSHLNGATNRAAPLFAAANQLVPLIAPLLGKT